VSFAADLAHCIALHDRRKAQNAAARARARANPALVAHLEEDARRRGMVHPVCHAACADCLATERADLEVRWVEYFRDRDINYP
jgi:hypothetical protein